jgi:outer membrane PBP1 activator LpoA protein
MRSLLSPRVLLAVVAVLALVACEGRGSQETETEAPTDEAAVEEYRLQADQACQGTRTELQLLRVELYERDAEVAVPADEAQQPFERAAALLQTELAQLRDLDPPASIAAEVEDWLAEVESAAVAYEEAGQHDEAAAAAVDRPDPLTSAEERADALGLGLCGSERIPDDELGDTRSIPTEDGEEVAPAAEDTQNG